VIKNEIYTVYTKQNQTNKEHDKDMIQRRQKYDTSTSVVMHTDCQMFLSFEKCFHACINY